MYDERLLSDRDWEILGPLLPPERGRACRPSHDNRRYLEGMLWIARSGAPWRMLPEKYGKWNSVYQRFRRWTDQGVMDLLFEVLPTLAEPDRSGDMMDATIVRAHHCAAGQRGGLNRIRRLGEPWGASPVGSTCGSTPTVCV